MNAPHPLDAIPDGLPTLLAFAGLLLLTAGVAWMTRADLDRPGVKVKSVVGLELTSDPAAAREAVEDWRGRDLLGEVRCDLNWDAAFIPVYAAFIALGCVMAARAFTAPGTGARALAMSAAWLP